MFLSNNFLLGQSMLHIINKSSTENDALESCLKHALPNSAILLYENAVLNAVKGSAASHLLEKFTMTHKIHVLLSDIEARGIKDKMMPGIEIINYEGFVDLVIKHKQVQPWN